MKSNKRKAANGRVSDQSTGLLVAAYYFTITLFALASMFPENRIWGINQWAYYSEIWRVLIFCAALLIPPTWSLLRKGRSPSIDRDIKTYLNGRRNYIIMSFVVMVIMGLSFYFLAGKVHFLGDGYLNLASLASESPLIKDTAAGEVLTHIWVKSLTGGHGETAALLSFQIVSILSGIVLLGILSFMSRHIFENRVDSFFFTLGLASSGFMLLYFGYVEYYSLFVLSVAIYTLGGLLIVSGQLNKWFIVPLLICPIFFHVLGVTLIPSSLFILLAGTKFYDLILKLTNRTKWIMILVGTVLFMTTFVYFYTSNYSFRFAVLPVLPDRFTVEGYTLFSINHVIDFLNLLLLLVPGLLIFLVLLPNLYSKGNLSQKPYQYLVILMFSTLGAVFLIDPRLGMPRDWDLLSFSGIPLAAFVYYSILNNRQLVRRYMIVSVIIVVGFFSLLPRAVRQHIPEFAIAEFNSYAALDLTKNRIARIALVDYYQKTGDTTNVKIESQKYLNDFPEREGHLLSVVYTLIDMNMKSEALEIAKQAIRNDPMGHSAYFALGVAYFESQNMDSAILYFQIANGMNPQSPDNLYMLGMAYAGKNNINEAEDVFKTFIIVDDRSIEAYLTLLEFYRSSSQDEKHYSLLSEIAQMEDAPVEVFLKLGTYLINKGEIEKGYASLRIAINNGLDSVRVQKL
ncbi:MAG: hypothetical protein IIC66_12640, partial [candidate division Zixibacteria bacterium]|nr:hypothetical protein [candidate division Zixibacteria bacterium]